MSAKAMHVGSKAPASSPVDKVPSEAGPRGQRLEEKGPPGITWAGSLKFWSGGGAESIFILQL
jgi:hypothetical protein